MYHDLHVIIVNVNHHVLENIYLIFINKYSSYPISILSFTRSICLLSYLYLLTGNLNIITFDTYFLDDTYHSHLYCVFGMEVTDVFDSVIGCVGSGIFFHHGSSLRHHVVTGKRI